MRLWHIDLIPYLPDSQLKAQWRELCAIASTRPNHILINYIYKYSNAYLLAFGMKIKDEMHRRNMRVNKILEFAEKLGYKYRTEYNPTLRYPEHNFAYLRQCFYNLQEKYQRGQKDFDKKAYDNLSLYFWNKESLYKMGKFGE